MARIVSYLALSSFEVLEGEDKASDTTVGLT